MASLADLQAERERLRAAQAKADFDKPLADTCALDDVRADAIAARTARLMELDPHYVDVIVRRWQTFTGQRATHAETGDPFPEAPEAQGGAA